LNPNDGSIAAGFVAPLRLALWLHCGWLLARAICLAARSARTCSSDALLAPLLQISDDYYVRKRLVFHKICVFLAGAQGAPNQTHTPNSEEGAIGGSQKPDFLP
jgi:hypothetical protein